MMITDTLTACIEWALFFFVISGLVLFVFGCFILASWIASVLIRFAVRSIRRAFAEGRI